MAKILVIGDSHVQYFKVNNELREIYKEFNGIDIIPLILHGSTIKGFGKRESTLNTQAQFFQSIQSQNPDFVCLGFGQVDIELGYYYNIVVKNLDLDFSTYCDELITTYVNTIKSLNIPLNRIIVKGVNATVLVKSRFKAVKYTSRIITENIKDEKKVNDLIFELSNKLPSAQQRVLNHLNFNEKLKQACQEIGVKYFDINKYILNESTGMVFDFLIPAFMEDHHLLDSIFVREVHFRELLNTISS